MAKPFGKTIKKRVKELAKLSPSERVSTTSQAEMDTLSDLFRKDRKYANLFVRTTVVHADGKISVVPWHYFECNRMTSTAE